MNELEKEYETHTLPEEIREKILDSTYLELNIGDIQVELANNSKRIYQDLEKNSKAGKRLAFVSFFRGKDEDKENWIEKDADYIVELLTYIADTGELLEEIKKTITEENYMELARLTDFLVSKYIGNFNYLQSRRVALEKSLTGISYVDNRYKDTRDELKEFIRSKLAGYRSNKHLEKKEKQ